jgi:negative regulator of replication initiation
MQSNTVDYEYVFQNCESDIAECDKQITEKESEIEVLRNKKQGFLELKDALQKILHTTKNNISQSIQKLADSPINVPSEVVESIFEIETPKGSVEISSDDFKGLEMTDAITKFLRIANYPQKTSQIAEALSKGGFESRSIFFAENVRSALRNASKNKKSEIVWKNKLWQLGNWSSTIADKLSNSLEVSKISNRKVGTLKWSKSIGDAAEDVLRNVLDGLHLDDIHTKLKEAEIYPTRGSLDAALRQDRKKRFVKVSSETYKLRKEI